jgi:hypothetical protein
VCVATALLTDVYVGGAGEQKQNDTQKLVVYNARAYTKLFFFAFTHKNSRASAAILRKMVTIIIL